MTDDSSKNDNRRSSMKVGFLGAITVLASACGGSSNTSTPVTGTLGFDTANLEYNACESDYYRKVSGSFEGEVVYSTFKNNAITFQCTWEIVLEIQSVPTPGPFTNRAEQCRLNSSIQSTTIHQVYLANPISGKYTECIPSNGKLSLIDPNSSVVNPEIFYENVLYPVSISVSGSIQEGSGPYNQVDGEFARYLSLVDVPSPIIGNFVVDETGNLEMTPINNISVTSEIRRKNQ